MLANGKLGPSFGQMKGEGGTNSLGGEEQESPYSMRMVLRTPFSDVIWQSSPLWTLPIKDTFCLRHPTSRSCLKTSRNQVFGPWHAEPESGRHAGYRKNTDSQQNGSLMIPRSRQVPWAYSRGRKFRGL